MKRAIFFSLIIFLASCGEEQEVKIGNVERGRQLLWQYGCGACHEIPGVVAASGKVGPPLENMAHQVYIAGVLPNTPENLVFWIRSPKEVDPLTVMPDLGVPEGQARDMAAFLWKDKG